MLFYKIEGSLVKIDAENEDSRKAHRANVRRIAIKSDEFNEKFCRDSFFFVFNSSDGILTVGVIAERQGEIGETLKAYLKHIECELADIVVTEITFNSIQNLLCSADRQDYIADYDEVMEKYGLDKISGRRGRSIDFGENIIDERCQSEVFSNAEKYLLNKTFLPELNRIYAGGASSKPYGHPVHYILQTDDRDTRREAYKTLLQALYANNRLGSKRYSFLDFKPGESFSVMMYDALYKVCSGGAVVVRYLANDDSEDNGFASSERDTVENICEVARRYRNQVLTVICLPRSLHRAGRFDRVIEIDTPRGKDALAIIAHYLKNKKVVDNVDAKTIARIMDGRSCAELETVINEAGHAVVSEVFCPESVTLVSAHNRGGRSGGFTDYYNDKAHSTLYWNKSRIVGALGGIAAIEQKYGIFDVGGERDLDQAFDGTKNLIVNTCISGFHLHCNGYKDTESLKSEQEKAIAAEVEKFYRKAKEIISLNFEFFEKIAAALAKKKLLSAVDIQKIKSECKIVPVAL